MYARWASFAVGLWLMLAPLVLGYRAVGPILHDVAMGLLVCIATLAALSGRARSSRSKAPRSGSCSSRDAGDRLAATAELSGGALLVLLALVPSARLVTRARRAGVRPDWRMTGGGRRSPNLVQPAVREHAPDADRGRLAALASLDPEAQLAAALARSAARRTDRSPRSRS
jgi:hypothetical protein